MPQGVLLSDIMQYFPPPPVIIPLATESSPGAVKTRKAGAETDLGAVTVIKTPITGVSPSGSVIKKYIAGEVDGRAYIYAYISYETAGAFVESLSVPFPTDAPQPWVFENWPINSWVYRVGGTGLLTARNDLSNAGAVCGIYKEANGSLSLKFAPGPGTIAAKFAMGLIPYFANI